jgi:hypothetical protein
MKRQTLTTLVLSTLLGAWFGALPGLNVPTAQGKTWSLENTPKEFRPKLCNDVRKKLAYKLSTQSYKTALKRKAEGTMWRKHEARIQDVWRLQDAYRRLNCKAYP